MTFAEEMMQVKLVSEIKTYTVIELIETVAVEREENAVRLRQVSALHVQLAQLQSKISDLNSTINEYELNGPKALQAIESLTK